MEIKLKYLNLKLGKLVTKFFNLQDIEYVLSTGSSVIIKKRNGRKLEILQYFCFENATFLLEKELVDLEKKRKSWWYDIFDIENPNDYKYFHNYFISKDDDDDFFKSFSFFPSYESQDGNVILFLGDYNG